MKKYIFLSGLIILFAACNQNPSADSIKKGKLSENSFTYEGTASITRGSANEAVENIYECVEGRETLTGLIKSNDGKKWKVPASTNFTNGKFPFASDLHNPCNGNAYNTVQEALSDLDGSDIIEIDSLGQLYTAFVFADNYFEMYINGIAVGKDKIPFTRFNSGIVRFRVIRPFTIAMKLVDWEEDLGLGTEKSRISNFHAGDGGMVAVIKDSKENIIAISDEKWKAQTFYTSPVKDLSCVSEDGQLRISENCDMTDSDDASAFYGLHWEIPDNWEKPDFDDSDWPFATTYSNETIGVDNKNAYTNFTGIFDDQAYDALFIWSSNVVLDNEVIVRYRVE